MKQGTAEGSSPQRHYLLSLQEQLSEIRINHLCLSQLSKARIPPPQRNRPKGDIQRTRTGKNRKRDDLKTSAFLPSYLGHDGGDLARKWRLLRNLYLHTSPRQHGTCSNVTRVILCPLFPWPSSFSHRTGQHLPWFTVSFRYFFSDMSPEPIPLIFSKFHLLFPSQNDLHTCIMQELKSRSSHSFLFTVWFP